MDTRVARVRTHGRFLLVHVILNLRHVTVALIAAHTQSLCLLNPLTYLVQLFANFLQVLTWMVQVIHVVEILLSGFNLLLQECVLLCEIDVLVALRIDKLDTFAAHPSSTFLN